MTSGNAYPNQPEPDTSRERIELETRILAAALRQSLERGDTTGSSHAHQQIFILLKASQEMGWEEPISLPPELLLEKDARRPMPDIDWGAPAEGPINPPQGEVSPLVEARGEIEAEAEAIAQPKAEPEHKLEGPAEAAPGVGDGLGTAASTTAPLLPLVKIPTFALIPLPSFTTAVPVTGAAAVLDFYSRLQVSGKADFASIHRSFLRKVRPLLREFASGTLVGQAKKDLLNSLQSLWIAHDILCDPVTRTDYDFRRMGLRSGTDESSEDKPSLANRPQLRIGELLLCAGLLETTELEIAADMHKAMPELMFGAFLVKQGFIEEDDLNCVLLGQQLLKTGGITAAQFQESMAERSSSGKDFGEILVQLRILTPMQLQEAYRNQMDDTMPRLPVVVATVSLQDSAADIARVLSSSDDEPAGEDEPLSESEQIRVSEQVREPESVGESELVRTESDEIVPPASRPRELLNSSPASTSVSTSVSTSASASTSASTPTPTPAPALNAGHAVPSWKDQLDWDSPAESENTSSSSTVTSQDLDAVQSPSRSDLAPSLASLYDNSDSRSATAELPPSSSSSSSGNDSYSAFARPEQSKKKSLTDLMADLEPSRSPPQEEVPEQSPFASIWADNSANSDFDLISDMVPPSPPVASRSHGAQDDFAPPSLEHDEDLSQVEEEFAALDAAADEALHIGEQENELAIEVNSLQDPNMPLSPEQQQESGSWQIVSVPASALASLLLDDEPEADEVKAKTTTPPAGKERRQFKTSFANDKPIPTKSNPDDNLSDDDHRNRRRKPK